MTQPIHSPGGMDESQEDRGTISQLGLEPSNTLTWRLGSTTLPLLLCVRQDS